MIKGYGEESDFQGISNFCALFDPSCCTRGNHCVLGLHPLPGPTCKGVPQSHVNSDSQVEKLGEEIQICKYHMLHLEVLTPAVATALWMSTAAFVFLLMWLLQEHKLCFSRKPL